MQKNNLIEFPKERTLKKRMFDKMQDQKSIYALSIASVLFVSVFLNEMLIDRKTPSDALGASRGLASIDSQGFIRDIAWEQELAAKLAKEGVTTKQLASRPGVYDQLVFGYLAGLYQVEKQGERVKALVFKERLAGDQALAIEQKSEFLKKYASAFAKDFASVVFKSKDENSEVFELIGPDQKPVGQARFELDHQGHVQSVQIE